MAKIPEPVFDAAIDRRRIIMVWSGVLAALCIVVGYFYAHRDTAQETLPDTAPAVPEVRPEVKLNVALTECSQITSRVDFVSGVMVNLGEDYRRMSGFVTNTGDLTVKLVGIDTMWKNEKDKVIQMGKVYVATERELKPGQRVEFSDSTQNYLAAKCGAKVSDWWIAPDTPGEPETPEATPTI